MIEERHADFQAHGHAGPVDLRENVVRQVVVLLDVQEIAGQQRRPVAVSGATCSPPSLGTVFRIASPELQQRFAPMRKIMDASRQVQRLGQLRPDSNPDNYFNAIRQSGEGVVR